MRLRDEVRLFVVLSTAVGGLLLALAAAFAAAAERTSSPGTGPAALPPSSVTFGLLDLRGAFPAAPEGAPTCFDRHHPCGPDSIATAPAAPIDLAAMPGAGLLKAPALLPAPMDGVAPHPAASLSILFRNFRE